MQATFKACLFGEFAGGEYFILRKFDQNIHIAGIVNGTIRCRAEKMKRTTMLIAIDGKLNFELRDMARK